MMALSASGRAKLISQGAMGGSNSMNEIDQFGMQTVDAIRHLAEANCYVQALVVLYSAIDTLAWADLRSGDVKRSDFCKWVDAYLRPQQMGCTSDDLYGARCALVHSTAAESSMSRKGLAGELWYSTSPHSMTHLQSYAQQVGARATVVYFTSLVAAFADGVEKFSQDLASDPVREHACIQRIRLWLRFLPAASLSGPSPQAFPAV
jgi:hypothetical protein